MLLNQSLTNQDLIALKTPIIELTPMIPTKCHYNKHKRLASFKNTFSIPYIPASPAQL
jgi:hypothetical protein